MFCGSFVVETRLVQSVHQTRQSVQTGPESLWTSAEGLQAVVCRAQYATTNRKGRKGTKY